MFRHSLTQKGNIMLTLEAKVVNVFSTKSYTNRDTGEVTPPGHKAQLYYEMPGGAEGTEKRIVLDDFNVRDQGLAFQKALGKTIRVPVGAMVNDNGKIQFFIPRGGLPTVVGGA